MQYILPTLAFSFAIVLTFVHSVDYHYDTPDNGIHRNLMKTHYSIVTLGALSAWAAGTKKKTRVTGFSRPPLLFIQNSRLQDKTIQLSSMIDITSTSGGVTPLHHPQPPHSCGSIIPHQCVIKSVVPTMKKDVTTMRGTSPKTKDTTLEALKRVGRLKKDTQQEDTMPPSMSSTEWKTMNQNDISTWQKNDLTTSPMSFMRGTTLGLLWQHMNPKKRHDAAKKRFKEALDNPAVQQNVFLSVALSEWTFKTLAGQWTDDEEWIGSHQCTVLIVQGEERLTSLALPSLAVEDADDTDIKQEILDYLKKTVVEIDNGRTHNPYLSVHQKEFLAHVMVKIKAFQFESNHQSMSVEEKSKIQSLIHLSTLALWETHMCIN